MKKLVVFVLLLGFLASTLVIKVQTNPLFSFNGVEKVCFVSAEKYDELECVQCGDLMLNFCSLETAKQNLQKFSKDAQAVQFYFEAMTVDKIIKKLKATVISIMQIEDTIVTVAYTPYYQDCILIDGKKVNLQIAENGGKLVAGLPAILTGF